MYELFIEQFVRKKPVLDWGLLHPLPKGKAVPYEAMVPCPDDAMLHHELLQKVVRVCGHGRVHCRVSFEPGHSLVHCVRLSSSSTAAWGPPWAAAGPSLPSLCAVASRSWT